uniref:Uncharacterized protein n=1 Tax=Avena sativa TaxID=4498 RepID=A0ACD5Z8F0_AVESA
MQMDNKKNSTQNVDLERMLLDGNAKPICLPFSLLEEITNCFSNDRIIGSGGFAVVYKGVIGEGRVAVKKLSEMIHEKTFYREIECLTKTKHKNIVRFLGYCADTHAIIADDKGKFVMADTRKWLLCFEYIPEGSLAQYIAGMISTLIILCILIFIVQASHANNTTISNEKF